jgi:hypothetical protein
MLLGDFVHLFQLLLFECAALGLDLAQLLERLQETPGQTRFVESQ